MWIIFAHSWWAHTRQQTDLGWGLTLQGYYPKVMARSFQGHLKVKQAKILNFTVFCCKGVFHKAAADISVAAKPSNTHPRGYSKYYVAWRGNTPLLYPPSPLISHPLQH